jgi:Pvc16 N-terminal domain
MSYTAISDVSETLLQILREQLVPEPVKKNVSIGVCSPADKGDFQLTLYLYNIEQSGEYRVTKMKELPDGNQQYPPLGFNLYYLLTAYSTGDIQNKAMDEHKILGRAIQVFYDNPILKGAQLKGALNGSEQEIRVEIKNLTYDEMMRIWHFDSVPYNLSIAYRVGPVMVDSKRIKETKRVVQSEFNFHREGSK